MEDCSGSTCKNCGKEVIDEFKTCLHCGLELPSSETGNVKLSALFGAISTRGIGFHLRAQERMCEIGRRLGCETMIEFEASTLVSPDRKSFIDVIWRLGNKIVAAFEISDFFENSVQP